jgi:ADP-heptose:LPS heptosyltransferase
LGDVVCTLPAAVALKQTFPDSHITWAVDPRFAGIVECCSAVDQIERVKPSLNPSSWPRLSGEFDAALDLQGLFKSGIIVAKARAEKKLGYHWQREGAWLFSSRVLPDPSSLHVVDQYVDVARAAGATMDKAQFGLAPKNEDVGEVHKKLGPLSGFLVVVNPGAGWVTKRWPPAHFSDLIDRLAAEGCACVLIGGKAEADRAASAEVVAGCRQAPQDLTGQTSVRELVALISLAGVHVGGDTGSSHIAAALGKPAIGLYSITKPERSCPYGQIDRCHYHPVALSEIHPGDVFRTVKEALS